MAEFQLTDLWKGIYEQERVASRIIEIAAKKEEGITFQLDGFGEVKLVIKAASGLGDNYMSDTYYNTAILSDGAHYKAFVKVLPNNPVLRAGAMSFGVYSREIGSYISFLPALREMMSEHGLTSDDIPLKVPRICYTNLDTSEAAGQAESSTVLVMEELSSQGFRMQDKRQGCTKKEAMMTLAALANYHALSHTWLKKFKNQDGSYSVPSAFDFAMNPMDIDDVMYGMLTKTITTFAKLLEHLGHHDSAVWLKAQKEESRKFFSQKDVTECGPLVAICHGDCWINNILFHYNDAGDAPDDVRLVDWQIILPQNPGRDYYHFLASSTTTELRKECGQELLEHYATTFISALTKLGVPLEDEGIDQQFVIKHVQKEINFGLVMGMVMLPAMLDTSMTTKLEEMGKDEETANKAKTDDNGMEFFNEAQDALTVDVILANELLCNRIVDFVEEFRALLQ